MAYKIRYGTENTNAASGNKAALRWGTAAGLAAGMVLVRLLGEAAASWAGTFFAAQPETMAELAVSALSDALAKGEGWYHALAVWARTIIDAGTF